MKPVLSSVGALLISAALLLAGGGLMSTLIAVRAQIEGFPIEAIGLMTSFYFAGFIAGCFATPHLVKRVGHVRVFAALSAMIAAASLTHAIFQTIPVWIVLRGLAGFSFAGLYMLIESWINEQTPNEKRGQVLSLYRMIDLGSVAIGQFMLMLTSPGEFVLFSLVAILICVAIFPISLSTATSPAPVTQTSLNLKKLVNTSPLAVAGAFTVGLTNGAFWGVAPVFVQQLGHPLVMVSLFMTVVIFSGAVLQWPAGFLSDKVGRRMVLLFSSLGAICGGIFLWQFAPQSQTMVLVGGAFYGMFAMQVFGMSAAHANDFAEPHEFVAISGGLLLIYGIGSVIGPSVAPLVMSGAGPSALFAFTACSHATLAVYALYRIIIRRTPKQKTDYISIPRPRSMNLILRADPRMILKRKK
ncbi:MAG: MFS transporter [Alphaproteobacteria bacterium]